jgi:hypothetical protein
MIQKTSLCIHCMILNSCGEQRRCHVTLVPRQTDVDRTLAQCTYIIHVESSRKSERSMSDPYPKGTEPRKYASREGEGEA